MSEAGVSGEGWGVMCQGLPQWGSLQAEDALVHRQLSGSGLEGLGLSLDHHTLGGLRLLGVISKSFCVLFLCYLAERWEILLLLTLVCGFILSRQL